VRFTPKEATAMGSDREYVLGTHDEEIARLALQHRVWRPRATAAWRRAGFTVGQTILDVGCGPGYAALDLAEIVGESGRVVAIDKSRRFLDSLEAARVHRGLQNITAHEIDLDEEALPDVEADGAWSRWVFAFVKRPRDLLARVGGRLKRGGVLVAHEYFDYATWRLSPRCAELEEFVRITMESWRASGGEPDVGLDLPVWLGELGFEVRTLRPIVEIIPASNFVWQWPKAYIRNGLLRLVDLGYLTKERAGAMAEEISVREAAPHTHMITPAVAEIIAVKR
jgi:SAM-dependent methyltransferase